MAGFAGAASAADPQQGDAGTAEAPAEAPADAAGEKDSQRIDELERQIAVLAREISRAFTATAVPEDRSRLAAYGLGPGASKVYRRDRGLSVGSYGELLLSVPTQDQHIGGGVTRRNDNVFDALRAVIYLGYKFNEKWIVNSEFEFEHAGTGGGGSVSLEFLTVDWLATDWLGVRMGLLLLPMGFINELHEPTTFFSASRPQTETRIIPTTWRENGAGFIGRIGDHLHYRAYAVNGLDARGFSSSGFRGGRQKGSRAIANSWAFVGRLDWEPADSVLLGASFYAGTSGQDQVGCAAGCDDPNTAWLVPLPSTPTYIYDLHGEYKDHGLTIRALFAQSFLGDVALLNLALGNLVGSPNRSVAESMIGTYGEIAYDVLPLLFENTSQSLEPFFRFEWINTQQAMGFGAIPDLRQKQKIYTVGLNYKPIPQVVFKADYVHTTPESRPDDVDNEVQFLVGYVF